MSCSAASVLFKLKDFNAVRVGLGTYGLSPTKKIKNKIKLLPALSWHTKIIQIKTIPAGTKVGYGGTFTTTKTTKLATIPVGYWDGYDRKFSNRAFVIVKGVKCPVRGRICMNLSMVDVSGVANIQSGDKATLLGKNGKKEITANDLADWANTINYEIVDRINPLLPRVMR
jgi:alanine racemase